MKHDRPSGGLRTVQSEWRHGLAQGCSGNFRFGRTLLEAWVPTPGALAPLRTAEGRAGGGWGRGSPPAALGVRGITAGKILKF